MKNKKEQAGYSPTAGKSKSKKRHFKRIPDTPENVAKAVLKPRKKKKSPSA